MSVKTHAEKFAGFACRGGEPEVYEKRTPLCGCRPTDPDYSKDPTCLLCQGMLSAPEGKK